MKRNEAYPGKFFRALDFDKPTLLTFKSVGREQVNDEEEKLVAHFMEDPRGMVINPTKFDTLTGLGYGLDSDDWVGKPVVVFQSKAPFQGKMVPSIGLRAPKAGAKQIPIREPEPVALDDDGDSIPF